MLLLSAMEGAGVGSLNALLKRSNRKVRGSMPPPSAILLPLVLGLIYGRRSRAASGTVLKTVGCG